MILEIVSGHLVKWLCHGVASIASVMCPRSCIWTCNLKKFFFFKITSPECVVCHCLYTLVWRRGKRVRFRLHIRCSHFSVDLRKMKRSRCSLMATVPRRFLFEKDNMPDRVRGMMEQREPVIEDYRRSTTHWILTTRLLASKIRDLFSKMWLPNPNFQNRRQSR